MVDLPEGYQIEAPPSQKIDPGLTRVLVGQTPAPTLPEGYQIEQPAQTTTTGEALGEGVMTGVGSGWRDEVYAASKASGLPEWAGGFRAPVGAAKVAAGDEEARKKYDEALTEIRSRQELIQQEHPFAYKGGEIAGTVLPATGVMKAVGTGSTLAGAVGRGAIGGGILGGIEGAGQSEQGGFLPRTIAGAEAAPFGATIGAGLPIVGHAIGSAYGAVAPSVKRFFGAGGSDTAAEARASGKLLNAAEREGMTPADIQQKLSTMPPEATIADVGPNFTQQAATIATLPGKGQKIIRGAIEGRRQAAAARVEGAVDTAMGGRVNYGQIERDIIANRKAISEPLYKDAYNTQIPPLPEVADFLASDTGKLVAKRAASLSRDEGIQFDPTTVRGVDMMKKALDDVIRSRKIKGRAEEVRVLTRLKNKLVQAVDDHAPQYAAARDAFAGESKIRDALDAGKTLFRDTHTPQEIGDLIVGMSSGERDAFMQGARASIQNIMGTARNDALAVRQLFQKGFNQEKLEMVLGKQAADDLLGKVGFETTAANVGQRVIGNSETASRVAGAEDFRPGAKGLSFGDAFSAGGFSGVVRKAGISTLDKLVEAFKTGRARDTEEAMAKFLVAAGSDRDKAIAAMMREALRRDRSGELARQVRNLALGGGLSSAVPQIPFVVDRAKAAVFGK